MIEFIKVTDLPPLLSIWDGPKLLDSEERRIFTQIKDAKRWLISTYLNIESIFYAPIFEYCIHQGNEIYPLQYPVATETIEFHKKFLYNIQTTTFSEGDNSVIEWKEFILNCFNQNDTNVNRDCLLESSLEFDSKLHKEYGDIYSSSYFVNDKMISNHSNLKQIFRTGILHTKGNR